MELETSNIANYKLGAYYCTNTFKKGGVCIFVKNSLKFSMVTVNSYCNDKDIELCVILLHTVNIKFYIISLYRAPTANFMKFLNILHTVLKTLYTKSFEFIIWGVLESWGTLHKGQHA
jgi:hypothetical protein